MSVESDIMRGTTGRQTQRAGAASRARSLCVVAALLLFPAAGAARDVSVEIDPTSRACRVHGRFHAAVPAALAWGVVADYDHIPNFVHSMLSSVSERGADGRLRVRQTASGGVFIFRRRMKVLLEIEETPGRRIVFHDVLGQDFTHYAGEWRIERDSTGTNVLYALEAEPPGSIARSMCRGVLRHTAEELLEQVRDEMLRRAAARRDSGATGAKPK